MYQQYDLLVIVQNVLCMYQGPVTFLMKILFLESGEVHGFSSFQLLVVTIIFRLVLHTGCKPLVSVKSFLQTRVRSH